MALAIIIVRIKPLAPTSEPATIRTLFSNKSPASAAAIPENEFNNEITTGMSPPPIGRTKPIPANNVKTKKTEKKLVPSKFTKAGTNDANRKIKEM
jgi:hypothetical protein